ncbi:Putative Spac6f6.09 protein [Aspergillus calidoustus]|uniref:Chromatin modification-related protein EAF6 n=1 Tax=Aspergillus calidoustus TaxID=454130 RepID=A0A0U4ZBK1_ASPCI|nr:Putative Spac6f6.09 protein [Aspergillus calidoustus]
MAESATATPAGPVANTPATSSAPTATGDNATSANPSQSQSQSQSNNVNASNGTNTTQATPSQPDTTTNPNSNPGTNDENQPPGSTSDARANRGLPYYEKLRRDLRDTLQKKRLMDKSMAQLEEQIYRFEQSYLEETTAGNIIKGFDTYIKGSSTGTGSLTGGLSLSSSGVGTSRRKAAVTDGDRVFSKSSASFMRDSPAPSSAQTTPSHAPTPSSMYNGSNGKPGNGDTSSAANSVKGGSSSSKNKKKGTGGGGNKGDRDDDDDDKPPSKRLKISYGRD